MYIAEPLPVWVRLVTASHPPDAGCETAVTLRSGITKLHRVGILVSSDSQLEMFKLCLVHSRMVERRMQHRLRRRQPCLKLCHISCTSDAVWLLRNTQLYELL